MFGKLSYPENPLFADFRRLERELDQIFGKSCSPQTRGCGGVPAAQDAFSVSGSRQSLELSL
jgi:hypothetical protein